MATPKLSLITTDLPADDSKLVETYIEELSGSSNSNMTKIDTYASETDNTITAIKGAGWTSQTIKGNYDEIQTLKQRASTTVLVTGTDTLAGTTTEVTTIQNNMNVKVIPSAFNTGAVTLNINSEGAKPLVKVQNQTGSTVYASLSAKDLSPNNPVLVTKSNDGLRYILLDAENYARNIYFENGTNDYTNLQTLLPTKANLNNPTFTSNINLTTINSKTPSYAITPTETIVTSGFATDWSGTLVYRLNQENQKSLNLDLTNAVDILTTGVTAYTLPVNQRPLRNSYFPAVGANSGGGYIANSLLVIRIITTGEITIYSVGGVTSNVRRVLATLTYY